MALVQLNRPLPLFPQYRSKNDCGPHAVAMAIAFYYPEGVSPFSVAREMALFRVPLLGATLPWGIRHAIRRHRLCAFGGSFSSLSTLKNSLAANWPVIVLVKPTDNPRCAWYTLHYRVLVGHRDDPSTPGGGLLYFNCSAAPPRTPSPEAPGNVAVDYQTFADQQWRTYLSYRWSLAIRPR